MESGNARLVPLRVWSTRPSDGLRARVARRDAGVARARIEPERLVRLIRGVWHCSAVALASVVVLLIVAPWMGSQMARHWIVSAADGFGAVANAWAMRGRHFGWAALAVVVVSLAVAGL